MFFTGLVVLDYVNLLKELNRFNPFFLPLFDVESLEGSVDFFSSFGSKCCSFTVKIG